MNPRSTASYSSQYNHQSSPSSSSSVPLTQIPRSSDARLTSLSRKPGGLAPSAGGHAPSAPQATGGGRMAVDILKQFSSPSTVPAPKRTATSSASASSSSSSSFVLPTPPSGERFGLGVPTHGGSSIRADTAAQNSAGGAARSSSYLERIPSEPLPSQRAYQSAAYPSSAAYFVERGSTSVERGLPPPYPIPSFSSHSHNSSANASAPPSSGTAASRLRMDGGGRGIGTMNLDPTYAADGSSSNAGLYERRPDYPTPPSSSTYHVDRRASVGGGGGGSSGGSLFRDSTSSFNDRGGSSAASSYAPAAEGGYTRGGINNQGLSHLDYPAASSTRILPSASTTSSGINRMASAGYSAMNSSLSPSPILPTNAFMRPSSGNKAAASPQQASISGYDTYSAPNGFPLASSSSSSSSAAPASGGIDSKRRMLPMGSSTLSGRGSAVNSDQEEQTRSFLGSLGVIPPSLSSSSSSSLPPSRLPPSSANTSSTAGWSGASHDEYDGFSGRGSYNTATGAAAAAASTNRFATPAVAPSNRTNSSYPSNSSSTSSFSSSSSSSSSSMPTQSSTAAARSSSAAAASSSSSSSPRGLVGLSNLGNTCFMNSCLQCLSNIPPLTEYLTSKNLLMDLNQSSPSRGRAAQSFADLLRAMWSPRAASSSYYNSVERPSSVKDVVGKVASRFLGYEQQDAQEFMRFFLDALNDDTNQVRHKVPYVELQESPDQSDEEVSRAWWGNYSIRNQSRLKDLFAGQLKTVVTCERCKFVSRGFDPIWDLSLPIPRRTLVKDRGVGGGGAGGGGGLFSYFASWAGGSAAASTSTSAPMDACSIEDCLDAFTAEERLTGAEGVYCSKCKSHGAGTKVMSIFRLPNVLVLHIKRFTFSAVRRTKLTTDVSFPVKGLNVHDYCSDSSPFIPDREDCVYDLVGVSNHMGGLGGGHYTADCLNRDTQQWHNFNDSSVSTTSPNHLSKSAAYILFYVKRDMRMQTRGGWGGGL